MGFWKSFVFLWEKFCFYGKSSVFIGKFCFYGKSSVFMGKFCFYWKVLFLWESSVFMGKVFPCFYLVLKTQFLANQNAHFQSVIDLSYTTFKSQNQWALYIYLEWALSLYIYLEWALSLYISGVSSLYIYLEWALSIYISGVSSLDIYIWSELSLYIYLEWVQSSGGGRNLRQSPYAVFHIYVNSKNCAGRLKLT